MNHFTIREPKNSLEFEAYYSLRFEVLRKPWNQPHGSEKAEDDSSSIHAIACDETEVLGVCRLHFNDEREGQIRFMAIKTSAQGKGLGREMLNYMEKIAKEKRAESIILHARENAVDFYKRCGYSLLEESYLLWGQIQHFLMKKIL